MPLSLLDLANIRQREVEAGRPAPTFSNSNAANVLQVAALGGRTGQPQYAPQPVGYDPTIDYQGLQATRGLGYAHEDAARQDTRALSQLGISQEQLARQLGLTNAQLTQARGQAGFNLANSLQDIGFSKADIERSYGRTLQDIGRSREQVNVQAQRALENLGWSREDVQRGFKRGKEDIQTATEALERSYGRATTDTKTARNRQATQYVSDLVGLDRQYNRLGGRQSQQAASQGVAGGGALQQAMRKRAENKAIDKEPLDRQHGYNMADAQQSLGRLGEDRGVGLAGLARSGQRLGEDTSTNLGRIGVQEGRVGQDKAFNLGGLDIAAGRAGEDRSTGLSRADVYGGRAQQGYQFQLQGLNVAQEQANYNYTTGNQNLGLNELYRRQDQATSLQRAGVSHSDFQAGLQQQRVSTAPSFIAPSYPQGTTGASAGIARSVSPVAAAVAPTNRNPTTTAGLPQVLRDAGFVIGRRR